MSSKRNKYINTGQATLKWVTKNVQLVLQHCCKTSQRLEMLRVLLPTFEPVRWQVFFVSVKTTQHRYSARYAAMLQKKVAGFLLPVLPNLQ